MSAQQGTPEWLQERVGIATASRFADILATIKSGEAADRRNYRAQLVVERLTGKPAENGFTTQAMRDGTEREPIAKMLYEVRTGHFVEEVGLLRHQIIECGASPDGLIGEDGGLEIKCPLAATHLKYMRLSSAEAPPEYVAQIQGSLLVTGREWWDFCSYNPSFPPNLQLIVRRIKRDNAYIDRLASEIDKFMNEVRADVESAKTYQEPE